MSNIKKSRVLLYIEFMKPQNLEYLENDLRVMVKKKNFPAFRTLMIGCDFKGLRQKSKYDNIPLVNIENEE